MGTASLRRPRCQHRYSPLCQHTRPDHQSPLPDAWWRWWAPASRSGGLLRRWEGMEVTGSKKVVRCPDRRAGPILPDHKTNCLPVPATVPRELPGAPRRRLTGSTRSCSTSPTSRRARQPLHRPRPRRAPRGCCAMVCRGPAAPPRPYPVAPPASRSPPPLTCPWTTRPTACCAASALCALWGHWETEFTPTRLLPPSRLPSKLMSMKPGGPPSGWAWGRVRHGVSCRRYRSKMVTVLRMLGFGQGVRHQLSRRSHHHGGVGSELLKRASGRAEAAHDHPPSPPAPPAGSPTRE